MLTHSELWSLWGEGWQVQRQLFMSDFDKRVTFVRIGCEHLGLEREVPFERGQRAVLLPAAESLMAEWLAEKRCECPAKKPKQDSQ